MSDELRAVAERVLEEWRYYISGPDEPIGELADAIEELRSELDKHAASPPEKPADPKVGGASSQLAGLPSTS
jgi:hypothetical protein